MTEIEFRNKLDIVFAKIIGCAFNSYNYWHYGVDELVFEAGMYVELEDAGIHPIRQEEFPIYYKRRPTPIKRKIDLVARDPEIGNVILELKTLDFIGDTQRKQLWSYMKLTNIRFGMLINFGPKGVFTERWELEEKTGFCHRYESCQNQNRKSAIQ